MDEIEELRKQLREEQRRRETAETSAHQERQRREEEQRRREAAEEAAGDSIPNNLNDYLQDCHGLWRAVRVVKEPTYTTKGDTVRPAGRLYPKRIIPWDDFVSRQERVWEMLSTSPSFGSRPMFPTSHQLQYVRSTLDPVSSEPDLRIVAKSAVEKAVQILVDEVDRDPELRARLNLKGRVTFESHTNLGPSPDESTKETTQRTLGRSRSPPINRGRGSDGGRRGKSREAFSRSGETSRATGARVTARQPGKGGRADQFCIYRLTEGLHVPIAAIEYKAPHKLTPEVIVTGLTGEIVPDRDIINRDDESVEYLARWLMAAVVTQCFSYMIHHGLRDGYIFTGEVVVFLHIPEDPITVYYYVCVPSLDVSHDERDGDRLYRTAVAQVFAFLLHAMAAEPPPPAWYDATTSLEVWAVEVVDILKKIPATVRKPGLSPSAYKPGRGKMFTRSPILTRARCAAGFKVGDDGPNRGDSDDDLGDGDPYQLSPTPAARVTRSTRRRPTAARTRAGGSGAGASQADTLDAGSPTSIKEQPFCSHKCLVGIVWGHTLDPDCPNIAAHWTKHISQQLFLGLIQAQLAIDRGSNADCIPLHIRGARGALFKIRLSSHGYTVVAKGVEHRHRKHIDYEHDVYKHLSNLQGVHIPVCIGTVSLRLPQYYHGGQYTHMLFLSWAGRPLGHYANAANRGLFIKRATGSLQELHRSQVLHKDAELRNFVYDDSADRLMIVDLERAEIRKRDPLATVSPNRKRKRDSEKGLEVDDFSREMCGMRACLSRALK